jgi:serine/threonine protein kinase
MAKVTIGSIIDHYQILEQIGKGGMGVVYKALNVNLEKFVAIKTIALGLAGENMFTSRFRTEARALAKLENPHIVRIYDMRADDNQWFIVMEYVEGITLAEKIRREKVIPWPRALSIFEQMLTAIGHAHRLGVIHRDIKPNNIMITPQGMVKITDFGLAKDRFTRSHTQPVSTGGTLYYMSPEQVKGLLFTDHRSDIYSLGLTLYEMLAGKIPFRKNDTDYTIREAIVKRQFPPPSHFNPKLSESLDALVMKMIAKEPADRYQDIDEIKQTVTRITRPAKQTKTETLPSEDKTVLNLSGSFFNSETAGVLPSQLNSRLGQNHIRYIITKYRKPFYLVTLCLLLAVIGRLMYPKIFSPSSPPSAAIQFKTSLNIITEPTSVTVYANSRPIGQSPVFLDSLRMDKIFISLQKDEFFPVDTLLTLKAGDSNTLRINLVPVARLAIRVHPADVSLLVDNRLVSTAEARNMRLRAGKHKIKIQHSTYESILDSTTIFPGQNPELIYRLVPVKKQTRLGNRHEKMTYVQSPTLIPSGSLEIQSTPDGSEIWIDSVQIDQARTPWVNSFYPAGQYQLTLQKSGFRDFVTRITVQTDTRNVYKAELIGYTGLLSVQVFPWGSIFIDDNLKKENTNIRYQEYLAVGQHQIRVVHPLLGTLEKSVRIEADHNEEITIDFNMIVNIRVTAFDSQGKPVWAEIIVDNKNTGEMTPKEIALHIGYHTIAAQKEGYILVNGEKEIMIENSLNEPLKFILKKIM